MPYGHAAESHADTRNPSRAAGTHLDLSSSVPRLDSIVNQAGTDDCGTAHPASQARGIPASRRGPVSLVLARWHHNVFTIPALRLLRHWKLLPANRARSNPEPTEGYDRKRWAPPPPIHPRPQRPRQYPERRNYRSLPAMECFCARGHVHSDGIVAGLGPFDHPSLLAAFPGRRDVV